MSLNVDLQTIATYLKVTTRQVANYRKAGMPVVATNVYCVADIFEWILETKINSALKQSTGYNKDDEESARTRKLIAEAEIKEVEVAQIRGQLVNINDSIKELDIILSPIRSSLLNFSARVSPYLVMVPNETEARNIVDKNMRHLMDQVANEVDESEVE